MSECWIGTEDISFGRRDRVVRAASGDGAMKLAPSAIMSGAQRERVGASRTDGEGHGEVSCLRAQSLVAPRAFANCKKDTYGDLLSTQTVISLSGKTTTSCCVLTQCRNWELEEPSRPRSQPERPATPHHPPDRDGRHRRQPVSRRLSRRLGCTGCVSSSVASRLGCVPRNSSFLPIQSPESHSSVPDPNPLLTLEPKQDTPDTSIPSVTSASPSRATARSRAGAWTTRRC